SPHSSFITNLCSFPTRRSSDLNCKGFDGDVGTVERGTPGWMPNLAAGRDIEISSFEAELRQALEPYGLSIASLPGPLRSAITARSEEHTSELQSRENLVCRLLL